MTTSDDKALTLHHASSAVKMLGSVEHLDCPVWTEELENILLKLSIDDINRLTELLRTLDAGIQRDMLPS